MIAVKSTNIVGMGYNEARCVLTIAFRSGWIYEYTHVPDSVYDDLLTAHLAEKSVGDIFIEQVRDKFPYTRRKAEQY